MTYTFGRLRRRDDPDGGWEPDFPPEVGYMLIADERLGSHHIYEVSYCEQCTLWRPPHGVSRELAGLIGSAKRYPPALAMAKSELSSPAGEVSETPDIFAARFGRLLRQHLQGWKTDGFSLAQAIRGDGIDLCSGEWYWVRTVRGQRNGLVYVSDDFYFYKAEQADFCYPDTG